MVDIILMKDVEKWSNPNDFYKTICLFLNFEVF